MLRNVSFEPVVSFVVVVVVGFFVCLSNCDYFDDLRFSSCPQGQSII